MESEKVGDEMQECEKLILEALNALNNGPDRSDGVATYWGTVHFRIGWAISHLNTCLSRIKALRGIEVQNGKS